MREDKILTFMGWEPVNKQGVIVPHDDATHSRYKHTGKILSYGQLSRQVRHHFDYVKEFYAKFN